jgi:hypothetical protein
MHNLSWPQIAQADIVFIQRPHQPVLFEIANLAKQMGRALWVDLDDDHLDVPTHNPHFKLYNDPDNVQAHYEILKLADAVTFSTDHLRKLYIARRAVTQQQAMLVKNALPFYLNTMVPTEPKPTDMLHILWRGSEKHSRDLARFLPQLNAIAKMEGVRLTFFGYHPQVDNTRQTVQFIPHLRIGNITGYFQTLATLNPHLVIVPLEFSQHNQCKSNIAMLEAHWAGAHVIGPAMEEWKQCEYQYQTENDFLALVENYVHLWYTKKTPPVEYKRTVLLEDKNRLRALLIKKLDLESQMFN